jgi:hypothetical protein
MRSRPASSGRRWPKAIARCVEASELAALSSLGERPAVRQVARWITGLPARLDPADAEHPHDIHPLPRARPAVRHVAWFARVIKHLSGDQTLTTWMNTVDANFRCCTCSPPG